MANSSRLEKSVQTAFLKKLRTIPYSYWIKVNDRTSIGTLDIYGVIKGYTFAIEMKRRGERLTKLQYKKCLELKAAAAAVYVVDETLVTYVFSRLKLFETGYHAFEDLLEDQIPPKFLPEAKKPRALRKARGPE